MSYRYECVGGIVVSLSMDPEEIVPRFQDLKFVGKKDYTVTLEDEGIRIGDERTAICLVAKVLSRKTVNCETFQSRMP